MRRSVDVVDGAPLSFDEKEELGATVQAQRRKQERRSLNEGTPRVAGFEVGVGDAERVWHSFLFSFLETELTSCESSPGVLFGIRRRRCSLRSILGVARIL
jgi:hypothetical protein